MFECLTNLNQWIVDHKELVTVVGIPLLTLLVTTVTTQFVQRRAAEERATNERIAAAERAEERDLRKALRVSEYRKDWIEQLRQEFVVILRSASSTTPVTQESMSEFARASQTIILLVNHEDTDFAPILVKIHELITASNNDERYNPGELSMLMQQFLKKEWSKLKVELEEVKIQ